MTHPTEPTDTDRIIQAHREEAARTRKLLVWIFIGIPAIGALIWFILFINAANGIDNATSSVPDYSSSDLAGSSSDSADEPFDDPGPDSDSTLSDPSDSFDALAVPLSAATVKAWVGKKLSDVPPEDIPDLTLTDPWQNFLADLPADKYDKWIIASVDQDDSGAIDVTVKPIGDAATAGDRHVHTVVMSASGHGVGDIGYTIGTDPVILDHRLPWTKTVTVHTDEISFDVNNANFDYNSKVSCSMKVDGKVVDQETSSFDSSGVASCFYQADN